MIVHENYLEWQEMINQMVFNLYDCFSDKGFQGPNWVKIFCFLQRFYGFLAV